MNITSINGLPVHDVYNLGSLTAHDPVGIAAESALDAVVGVAFVFGPYETEDAARADVVFGYVTVACGDFSARRDDLTFEEIVEQERALLVAGAKLAEGNK